MPRNDYLKTATNVPALPSGWDWWVSYRQIDKQSRTDSDKMVNWTELLIEITDRNDEVVGSRMVNIMTKYIARFPSKMDDDLVKGCRAAYNNLYSDRKASFYKALDIQ